MGAYAECTKGCVDSRVCALSVQCQVYHALHPPLQEDCKI